MMSKTIKRATWRVAAACVLWGSLVGLNGGAAPPAAYALSGSDTDPCFPQTVTAADAELVGTLRLLDPAMVGVESRISMADAAVRLPNPRCDGQFLTVPLTYRWAITTRPSGSVASLTSTTTTLVPRLTPDRAGSWQVSFTACPSGCRVTGTTITIPPLTRSLSFTAVKVVEGRLSSDDLDSTMNGLLAGTRIQISHTGNGTTASGPPQTYTVRYTVPYYKYQELCDNPNQTGPEPPICAKWEQDGLSGQVTYHTYTPQYTSYVDFGPQAEAEGAPPVVPLPIDPPQRDVPTSLRAVLLAAQGPVGIVYSVDVDQVRLLANDLNINLGNLNTWSSSIGGGSINLDLSLDSDIPSIKCEAHFTARAGYLVTVDSGWADELCPDFDLSQMDLSVKLFPTVLNGALAVRDAQVTAQLEPQGLQSELIDFMTGATDQGETKIDSVLHDKLLEPQTRTALGGILTKVLKHRFPDLCQVVSAQVVDTDLVVRYVASSPIFNSCGNGTVLTTAR